ncbi:MAG: YtxH domain-containing protein [Flavobacterium sp.]|nr:YtxH domain-containing protein [Flavobacterium sp.]
MSTGKVALGTLAGLAIGGILGILYAPEKGSVTRQKIMEKGNDYAEELKSKYNDFADTISEKLHSAKEFAQEISENGKAELDELKNDANRAGSKYNL